MLLLLLALIWLLALLWTGRARARSPWAAELWRDLWAGGALVAGLLAFFWRTLSGDVFQPADGGDLVSFLYPTYRFAAATLSQGALPLWNPTLYGGAPFISDIQAGFLYPPNLLLFIFNPTFDYATLQALSIGHVGWAGLGMYTLLRTLRWPTAPVRRAAALLGALAFMVSDPFLIHLGNLNLIAVLSWLPWVLAAYVRGLRTGAWRWLGTAALLYAVANYAGHAQSTLYVGMALGLLTLGHALLHRAPGYAWLWRPAAGLVVVLLLTALLSAPALLPAAELTAYTARQAYTYQDTIAFSLAPAQLLGLLTPGFFGRGPALHWGLWERVEMPYAGVPTLLLAVGALLLASGATRRRLWPWLGLAAFGLVAALGVYAILHGWLTLVIPGLAQMRAPARALILWQTGLAVVAAVGMDILLRQGQESLAGAAGQAWLRGLARGAQAWWLLFLPLAYLALLLTQGNETVFLRASVAALALVIAAAAWAGTWAVLAALRAAWLAPRTAALLLLALLYGELAASGAYTDISSDDPTRGFRHPEIVAFLRDDPDLYRIDSRTDIAALWQPDTAALYGLEDVSGIVNPLALAAWQAQWEATGGRGTRAYDLLNVKYVIVRDGTPLPDGKFTLALDAPGDLAVYRNATPLPRAWVVHRALPAADIAQAQQLIQSPDFDPTTAAVVLAEEMAGLSPFGPLPEQPAATPPPVTVTRLHPSALRVVVDAAAPGLLVLSEVWYPGWRATVNGAPQPVLHANGALRGVPIPAGSSVVEMWFSPTPWRVGVGLAGVGLLMLVGVWVWAGRATGRAPQSARPNY